MRDLFEKIYKDKGPLGKWASQAEGYFVFPKLEGQISNRMKFQGKDVITWSINDYLGLANHPEVRRVDAEASNDYGAAYPMGARMMSGLVIQLCTNNCNKNWLLLSIRKPPMF